MNHNSHQEISDLLIGRKVVRVEDEDTLVLDTGLKLRVIPNVGSCSCGAGDYYLTELNICDNMIMNVEFEDSSTGDDSNWEDYGEGTYRIFVFADSEKIKLLEVAGDDGSGYYGTGYWIEVK